MATYKISYLVDASYAKQGHLYVDNAYDENDAIELAVYKYGLEPCKIIQDVIFVCE